MKWDDEEMVVRVSGMKGRVKMVMEELVKVNERVEEVMVI